MRMQVDPCLSSGRVDQNFIDLAVYKDVLYGYLSTQLRAKRGMRASRAHELFLGHVFNLQNENKNPRHAT